MSRYQLQLHKELLAAAIPPTIWEIIYGKQPFPLNLPPIHRPNVTAGFRWAPEIFPKEYAIVRTVKPNASATPTRPIPTSGNLAASTALPIAQY